MKTKDKKTKNEKTNYTDIGRIAGVSIATVSRTINNRVSVKPETRLRVLDAMESLEINTTEYRIAKETPNNSLLIFNIPSLENPFYSEIAKGAKSAANRHGYHLLINEEHINTMTIDRFISLIKGLKAVGVITLNHISTDLLLKLNSTIPLVQCCEYDEKSDISYVSIDDFAIGKMITEYIISKGKDRIAFVNGPLRYKYARHRLDGYLSVLKKANLPIDSGWIIQLPEINYEMAVSAITQLLSSSNRPNAVFAVSDVFAAAVIKAAARTGLKIPQDLIVVGVDNINIAIMTTPSITTINQPKFQLGFMATEILVEKIENSETPIQNITLDTEFIIREST